MSEVVFVSGISSGIGFATAKLALRHGHSVVGIDINEPRKLPATPNRNFMFRQGNVADADFISSVIGLGHSKYGRITQFFNNAGILGDRHEIHDFDLDLWVELLNINLTGSLLCCQQQIGYLIDNAGGNIVNNASISGIQGSMHYPLYSVVKHGIVGLTKSISKQYASKNIRCNAICPTTVSTPMTDSEFTQNDTDVEAELSKLPLKRFAKACEVAQTALWLLSNEASYITGQTLVIDGGSTS